MTKMFRNINFPGKADVMPTMGKEVTKSVKSKKSVLQFRLYHFRKLLWPIQRQLCTELIKGVHIYESTSRVHDFVLLRPPRPTQNALSLCRHTVCLHLYCNVLQHIFLSPDPGTLIIRSGPQSHRICRMN